jgi:transcriptional regulator with XRE-family HTH domain
MTLPQALFERILAGAHPVTVWRQHRGWTVAELASRARMPPATLRRIEGRKRLTEAEAGQIAAALHIHPCELRRFPGAFESCLQALRDAPAEPVTSASWDG